MTLRELIEMDANEFYGSQYRRRHYALSSFWIRYFLSPFSGDLGSRFRSFLQSTARGEPISGERLVEELGTDWASLQSGFEVWLRVQFLTPPSERLDPSD